VNQQELATALKPNLLRLKQIGAGIKVGKVLGSRVLVKTVTARTDLDRVEQEGSIIIPKWVKQDNTPLPTTGIVIQVGPGIKCEQCNFPKNEGHSPLDGGCLAGQEGDFFSPVIAEGDMVMFPKFAGCDFKIENEDFRVVEAAEIMCTLVDTEGSIVEIDNAEEDSLS